MSRNYKFRLAGRGGKNWEELLNNDKTIQSKIDELKKEYPNNTGIALIYEGEILDNKSTFGNINYDPETRIMVSLKFNGGE